MADGAAHNDSRAAGADVLPGADIVVIESIQFTNRWVGKGSPLPSLIARMLLKNSEPSGRKNVSQRQFLQA